MGSPQRETFVGSGSEFAESLRVPQTSLLPLDRVAVSRTLSTVVAQTGFDSQASLFEIGFAGMALAGDQDRMGFAIKS